ncbi:MAG: M48 family metallopeptidase [Candidatus Rokubacteria bacterium]|nr:M48 family metallopeptidase [Candidatus Rokubacteria bacterium]
MSRGVEARAAAAPPAARRRFRTRVRHWADRLAVKPLTIEFRTLRSKWASCSDYRRLAFAEILLSEPREFQDFVIVHELLHLRVPNHGPLFRTLLSVYQPEWRIVSANRVTGHCSRRGPTVPPRGTRPASRS